MSKLLLLLLLAVIILMTQSFSLHSVRSKSLLSKSKVQFSSRSEETTTTEQPLLAIITAASASLMTIPQLALADDGKSNAFFFPLVISLMTLLPFLYYQQALKPKPRTAKQIQIDKDWKPVDQKDSSVGKVAEARTTKKK